jgi:uncharacterized OB-fold protein
MPERPLPDVMPEAAAWWDATRASRLLVQRCLGCGHHQLYPRAICTACHRTALELVPASGEGTVYSHTTVHRPAAGFEAPYVVAIVRLAEGPRLLTNITGCAPEAVHCEMPVSVAWEPLPDGRRLPVFTPRS